MSQGRLPLVVEPEELQTVLDRDDIFIVDLSPPYHQSHIPNSVHLDYSRLISPRPPITGLLPEPAQLSALFSSLGLSSDTHVVAYDDEGGGKACRLLWTLDVVGHGHYSLLNGGLNAWLNEHHPTTNRRRTLVPSCYTVHINDKAIADKNYIRAHLYRPDTLIVDCRSPSEYVGHDVRAQRGGHIPGAVNIEWTRAIDQNRNLRIKSPNELRKLFEGAGVTPDKEAITYCHSHRRSAFGYFVLKSLGYAQVRGYPGSWSEWGNDPDTPIEL
jgi:thiosulfate/3-mercaptopyruvate sulfurtransferase